MKRILPAEIEIAGRQLMATSRNTTAENAEATVVKFLAKTKLQFPVMTEKFE